MFRWTVNCESDFVHQCYRTSSIRNLELTIYMTEIFNLHTLCRCCHSDGSFKSLQLSYVYDNRIEVYSTMLKETLDITINPPPFEASYTICDCCILKLRDAAHFKQQVLDCEQKFEEYCKNEQALTVKEEIDYESNNESDLDRDEKSKEAYDHDDDKHIECKDVKCDVRDVEIKVNEDDHIDNIDEGFSVKIKVEKFEVAPNTTHESIPIEYVATDKTRILVTGKTSKRNSVKATIRRVRRMNYQVDPELESYIKTEDSNIYTCRTCDKKYRVLKLLRNHILKQHKNAYKCQFCSLQCVGRIHYLRHTKTHSNELFKCQYCEKSFRESSSLYQHMNIHTKTEKFQCDICHKFFAYKQTLRKHLLWHYGANKTCMCDICGHAFNDTSNLNNHIRAVHEKQRPFKCSLCPKTFTANKHLKQHLYFHTGEKPYKCDMCIDEFVSAWKLKHHQYKYHPNSAAGQRAKLYTCKVCKLQVETRGKFMSHLKTHVGEKEYKCHLCTKDFTCKYSLNRHINEHSGIKAYGCDLCDKKYTQQSQLRRHKKNIHDPNSKSYPGRVVERVKCDLCNKSFKDIEKHMESHKTRPHTCEICLKCYPERNTLNRHILIVHQGVRRYPCSLCDKKYTKWSCLQKHTKKVHKLELKKEVEES